MKRIMLMITGSIAAPKALELYDLLKKDYEVTVVATPSAFKFVKFPKTITVHSAFLAANFYHKDDNIEHTDLALSHDLIVVYPASMNFISKAAVAIPDNLCLATFLASDANKLLFPAMNNNMYLNHSFQKNLELLSADSTVEIITPDTGMLACNVVGIGRAKEPEVAFNLIKDYLQTNDQLLGKTVLINYGATRMYLDDIRYITNHSSGKMGQALVAACLQAQAQVIAVTADTAAPTISHPNLTTIKVTTNQEMLTAMEQYYHQADFVICAAALNDYLYESKTLGKISKTKNPDLTLNLVPNLDVLQTLGAKKTKQVLIGFSAEDSFTHNGVAKMQKKHCDGIIINDIKTMQQDKTDVQFILKTKEYHILGTKRQVAHDIIKILATNSHKE